MHNRLLSTLFIIFLLCFLSPLPVAKSQMPRPSKPKRVDATIEELLRPRVKYDRFPFSKDIRRISMAQELIDR